MPDRRLAHVKQELASPFLSVSLAIFLDFSWNSVI